tara:strand:- start:758 stop:1201 length:444 start_codon:yes stop_codon:yes gene_type:complete
LINKLLSLIKKPSETQQRSTEQTILLAAVTLLVEVAKADHNLSSEEELKLSELVSKNFGKGDQDVAELISLAISNAKEATSLYEFTSVINKNYSELEKFQLITNMWEIAYSDESIDKYEEHLIRKVADLIYLSHAKYIEAKHLANNT